MHANLYKSRCLFGTVPLAKGKSRVRLSMEGQPFKLFAIEVMTPETKKVLLDLKASVITIRGHAPAYAR
jgi:hypothetical protein